MSITIHSLTLIKRAVFFGKAYGKKKGTETQKQDESRKLKRQWKT